MIVGTETVPVTVGGAASSVPPVPQQHRRRFVTHVISASLHETSHTDSRAQSDSPVLISDFMTPAYLGEVATTGTFGPELESQKPHGQSIPNAEILKSSLMIRSAARPTNCCPNRDVPPPPNPWLHSCCHNSHRIRTNDVVVKGKYLPYVDINPHKSRPKWPAYVGLSVLLVMTIAVVAHLLTAG